MAKAPKTTTAPTGQIAPFGLRMLPELKERIENAARESGRSMNAEVVARLEKSFDGNHWLQEIGLSEQLEEAAKNSGRSIEGEAYARLLDSLGSRSEVERLKKDLDYQANENRQLRMELAELRSEKTHPVDTVYLLLDASGYPISWEEIRTLWRAVAKEANLNVVNLEASVITPDMESSSRRGKEAVELARKLKEAGKSTVLPKYIPGHDPVRAALEQAAASDKLKKRTRRISPAPSKKI
jgi:hypothetical protein